MKLLLSLVLLGSISYGNAQNPKNGNNSTYHLNNDTGKVADIREELIKLAMQNPKFEILDHRVAVADYNIRIAKSGWLNTISAQGNINEFTINPKSAGSTNNTAIYYPRYNFGVSIPFDLFSNKSNNVKIARENYLIAEAEKTQKFREIKTEVLTKYEDYLLNKAKLDLQFQITQDQYTAYKQAEKDYGDGAIKVEEFNRTYHIWVDEQSKKLTCQRDLNVSKYQLEEIIGVKLEDVLRRVK